MTTIRKYNNFIQKADCKSLHRLFVVLVLVMITVTVSAEDYYYWVGFKNKQATPHTFANPSTYLTQRAIDRRIRQGIAIDSADLPVSPVYMQKIRDLGVTIFNTSKWLNGVIVSSNNGDWVSTFLQQGFVSEAELIKTPVTKSVRAGNELSMAPLKSVAETDAVYGIAYNQINLLNGIPLHEAGYKGTGMQIAVIDNGFYQVDVLTLFDQLNVLGTRDFIAPANNVYEGSTHGLTVLSVMAGYAEGSAPFCGTAPEAGYWLLRTEDASTESPLEADLWVCAAEFSDSVGVDVIQTSLGYFTFDNSTFDYTYDDLNGTTRISRAANLAVDKGMVVVASAGNEGNKPWHYISVLGDAVDVLSVGSVRSDMTISSFSGYGPTPDGRIKPDVVGMGESVAIINPLGEIGNVGTGTSFAAPAVSGLVACLWQSLPNLKAKELVQLVRNSATRETGWDINQYGYGVPDFTKAWVTSSVPARLSDVNWKVWPNPFISDFTVDASGLKAQVPVQLTLYNSMGGKVWSRYQALPVKADDLQHLGKGVYILTIDLNKQVKTIKLIKQ